MKTKPLSDAEYNPEEFEAHWRSVWEDTGIYWAKENSEQPKFYCLDYFPYPSGEGLHVGHCRNYVPTDVVSRYMRMRDYNVLHPMGWDAFGEPAEQNAIRRGVTPRETTDRNTANYKRQMNMIGTSYDWSREIDSSRVEYYRWTQWMFLKMYKRGLAYRDTNWQWWCPTCATTLSSHEIDGDRCWRGHPGVTKKEIPAWYFRITAYASELISGLETVDWPLPIKQMQWNWIGRSEGVEVQFAISGMGSMTKCDQQTIKTFTTRPDTIFGVTFIALAPEHPLLAEIDMGDRRHLVEAYIQQALRMSEIDRSSTTRQVSGVFTGLYATNPLSQEEVPIFVADYVLPTYGTGAVMGVPAHDQHDFEFAVRYGLEIRQVVKPDGTMMVAALSEAYADPGILVNSGSFSGLPSTIGWDKIAAELEAKGLGRRTVHYRMRDWLISRQRYWGTPIPIIHCPNCGEVPVPENELPVELPEMDDFTPDGSGSSPLARVSGFVNVDCPNCGTPALRETDTMGGFACSSWYFLRFTSPHYTDAPFEPAAMRYWMPVDLYVGGAEHAVLHLLYARFWTKVLADEDLVPFREPFAKLVNQGQLHGPDGLRMSKSRGNVVVPDEMVVQYGADALRIYGMFMAPFEQNVNWNSDGINGAWRFLNRVWSLYQKAWNPDCPSQTRADPVLERELHHVIKRVTQRIEQFRFNTMVSALMEFVNLLHERVRTDSWCTVEFQISLETLIILLAPAAPFIAEELWARTSHPYSVHQQAWPVWDDDLVRDASVEIAVQVNGRKRDVIWVEADARQEDVLREASEIHEIQKYIQGKMITRVIYVPGKILNLVTNN